MTTVATDQLTETIQNLKETTEAAINAESVEHFCQLEQYVNEVEAFVREVQQGMWARDAKAVIRNLEKNQPLSPSDLETIRTFLVSDAVDYLKHENNYAEWKHELQRLMDDLARRANTVDRSNIGDLRGVLKDAIRLVPDIRNYLEERSRVAKFDEALETLDAESRKLLVRLLNDQLRSAQR